jgi:hypothetical protein
VLHQNLAPETDQYYAADDFGSPPDQHPARSAQQDARGRQQAGDAADRPI